MRLSFLRSTVVAVLVFAAAAAAAAVYDATLQITPPTTRVGGAPLLPSEIQGYRVFLGCDATPVAQPGLFTGTSSLSVPSLFPADGVYSVCYSVVDTGDRESAKSNAVAVDVKTIAKPNAGNLTGITVSCPGGGPVKVISSSPTSVVVECDAP